MKVFAVVVTTILIAVSYAWLTPVSALPPQEEQAQVQKLEPLMERKLEQSKTLLEGIATEDFEKIAGAAQALSLMSLESGWNVLTTQEFLDQSADFRRSIERIRSAAEKKNIDRAALGYLNMTINCVECHKYLRQNNPVLDRIRT